MFFDYQYQPEHDVMSHISAVEALANRLNDLGCPVNEVQLITKITMTLPPSFDSLVDVWENLDDDKKSMQLLISRLLKHESTRKMTGRDSSLEDAAFFAKRPRSGSLPESGSKQRPPRIKCNFCGKRGHTEEKCWEKERQEKAKQTNQDDAKANMARTNYWPDHYAFTSISFLTSLPDRDSAKWYADSGASQHMCDQRWMFHNFISIIPGSRPVRGIGVDSKPLQVHGRGYSNQVSCWRKMARQHHRRRALRTWPGGKLV